MVCLQPASARLRYDVALRLFTIFDLVCDVDLGDPKTQSRVGNYINDNNVMIVIMAPYCRAIGPPSSLNFKVNLGKWENPSAQICHIWSFVVIWQYCKHGRQYFGSQKRHGQHGYGRCENGNKSTKIQRQTNK